MITKDDNVYEVLDRYPQLAEVFEAYGLACVGCPGSSMETIADAAKGHSLDLEELLAKINSVIE